MICGSKEKEKLYGVTSWRLGCAKGVSIYARVAFHRDWIDKEIKVNRLHIILSNALSIYPDKTFFVQDKIRFVLDKIILSMA